MTAALENNAELLEEIREHIKKKEYSAFKQKVQDLNYADTALLIQDEMEEEGLSHALKLFRLLPKSIAAEVFSFLDIDIQQDLINEFTTDEATGIMNDMYADDLTDLMDEMPANIVRRLLQTVDPDVRKAVNSLLKYDDDSAGSIMTVEFMSLTENQTVSQALEHIRKVAVDKETVNTCFIIDPSRILTGIITLRKLVISDPGARIADIMDDNVIYVNTSTDQEEVADMFQKYDLTSMPVVDSENRLVGIITIDDVVDIMRAEATEDIEIMAAITPSEKPYLKTGVFHTYLQRIPWLLLLMISATVTSGIMQNFEAALSACVALAAFVPMLTDTGGNSGSQASVTVIRGLSLNEIEFSDLFRVMFKELRVGFLCGLSLGCANFLKMLIFDVRPNGISMTIAAVISLTLFVTVMIAKLVGCFLPILAKKLKLDPAVMASPFITTIVDALSLIVYFNIASMLLHI